MARQTTLASAAMCAGVGLHSGQRARLTLRPAAANTGLVFRRTDVRNRDNIIVCSAEAVCDTRLGTTIANAGGVRVATVEHVLAAVAGLGVDNLILDLDGPEPPAMDGSAAPFAQLIERAGVQSLSAPRRTLVVERTVEVEHDGKRARFEPAAGFEIDVTIDFENAAIGRQRVVFAPHAHSFVSDIAPARTFAFLGEVEAMRQSGLALGGSMDNCVVLNEDGVMNAEGLRFGDEFVRHKLLDALGDLAVLGRSMRGRYVCERPGHAVNNVALRGLLANRNAWSVREEAVPAVVVSMAKPASVNPLADPGDGVAIPA